MKCSCCKKNIINPYYYNDDKRAPLCAVCTKNIFDYNIQVGISLWKQALDLDEVYHIRAREYISTSANEICAGESIKDMAAQIRDDIIFQIKAHLQFYSRDSLVAVCVFMKQICRVNMDTSLSNFWFYSTEYNVACTIIRYCYEIEEFEGGMLYESEEYGMFDFITAVVFLRILLVLEGNIEICEQIGYENRTIQELIFNPIEWGKSEEYFEEYRGSSCFEKPEDYCIKNCNLEKKLRSEHKDMKSIIGRADKVIKQVFGFQLEVMMDMMKDLMVRTPSLTNGDKLGYSIVAVSELQEKYKSIADCKTVDRILNTFTFHKAPENLSNTLKRGFYELRSIVRFGNQVMIVPYDLFQNALAFRSYALSGHNINLYLPDVNNSINLSQVLNYTSTFVVYTLVDILMDSGYILPMEKKTIGGVSYQVPMAEIKKVMKDKINLLKQDKDLTDIDILACDKTNKIIYNIEVKHYKPAFSVKQMLCADRDKVEKKQIVQKTLEREFLIYREQESFLRFLNVPTQEQYTVKSFIVSSRPNYYTQLCTQVECITWRQFCERAQDRSL